MTDTNKKPKKDTRPAPLKGRNIFPEVAPVRKASGNKVEMAYPKADRIDKGRTSNEFDLAELYDSRAKFTAQEKLSAVTAYILTGTTMGAQRLTGISNQTICDWKNKSSWWPDAYRAVKLQKQEEMDGIMTSIIHLAGEELVDRLLNGDEVVTKDGDIRNKKLTGRDVAWIMAIIHDKRALLRGDPTSRTEKVDQNKLLDQMAEKFKDMGAKDDPRVVNEQ